MDRDGEVCLDTCSVSLYWKHTDQTGEDMESKQEIGAASA